MTYESIDHGLFLLNVGDTARSIAERVYNDGNKYQRVLEANPTPWDDLERVTIPGKKGRVTTVGEGESPQDIVRRVYPDKPYSIFMESFFRWNGGKDYRLIVGDQVFIPDRS
jgi:LysM domain